MKLETVIRYTHIYCATCLGLAILLHCFNLYIQGRDKAVLESLDANHPVFTQQIQGDFFVPQNLKVGGVLNFTTELCPKGSYVRGFLAGKPVCGA